jgi:hypothetical protein
LVFINLALLFVLPWQTASAARGGCGLLIIWLSLHLQQRASFVFGVLLQVIAGAAFLLVGPLLQGALQGEGLSPLAHAGFWTLLVLGVAALLGAWRLHHVLRRDAAGDLGRLHLERLSQLLLVWGLGWWTLVWASEVLRFASAEWQTSLLLLTLALSVARLDCAPCVPTGAGDQFVNPAGGIPAGAGLEIRVESGGELRLAGMGGVVCRALCTAA